MVFSLSMGSSFAQVQKIPKQTTRVPLGESTSKMKVATGATRTASAAENEFIIRRSGTSLWLKEHYAETVLAGVIATTFELEQEKKDEKIFGWA